MKRPFLILAGISFLIFLACGGTSSVVGGGSSAAPTSTAPATTGPEAIQSNLTLQYAPGYYYTDSPNVDCSNVDWAVILVNAAPDGRPTGPANWETVTGAPLVPYGPVNPGTAPNITVSPASGFLAPGAQVLVHITGSFTTDGPGFDVQFLDPHGEESVILELNCQG